MLPHNSLGGQGECVEVPLVVANEAASETQGERDVVHVIGGPTIDCRIKRERSFQTSSINLSDFNLDTDGASEIDFGAFWSLTSTSNGSPSNGEGSVGAGGDQSGGQLLSTAAFDREIIDTKLNSALASVKCLPQPQECHRLSSAASQQQAAMKLVGIRKEADAQSTQEMSSEAEILHESEYSSKSNCGIQMRPISMEDAEILLNSGRVAMFPARPLQLGPKSAHMP